MLHNTVNRIVGTYDRFNIQESALQLHIDHKVHMILVRIDLKIYWFGILVVVTFIGNIFIFINVLP
jgi:hypothetical protein